MRTKNINGVRGTFLRGKKKNNLALLIELKHSWKTY